MSEQSKTLAFASQLENLAVMHERQEDFCTANFDRKAAAELRRLHDVEQQWIALNHWVSRPLSHLHEVNQRLLGELQHVQAQLKARHGRWHPDVVRIRNFIQGGGAT